MNEARLRKLRANAANPAYRAAAAEVRQKAEFALRLQYPIRPGDTAAWGHDYHCHDDGAKLVFAWEDGGDHICSQCGKAWRGEPFDSARRYHVHHQLGLQARSLGAMWQMTGEHRYAIEAARILSEYAEHYAGFPEHGNVPFNGPGKLFAQTLDESHWIINLCLAYRFVEDCLDAHGHREQVRESLFRPCADFLVRHIEQQIHNHNCWITAAIVCVGLTLDDETVAKAGLHGRYGLLDQLERGILEDGLWYEGSMHYHYYVLDALIWVSLLGEGGAADLRRHPKVERMFETPLRLLLADGTFPIMNDMKPGYGLKDVAPNYEAACDWYGAERFGAWLAAANAGGERGSLHALLFGCEADVPAANPGEGGRSACAPASGLALLTNRAGWELVVKHAPFGGEHDHMDRLGLSLRHGKLPFFIDCGTTAYGVPVHYEWFKHTYSHNTLCIDGKDQPPADARLVGFREESWGTWCEGEVSWGEAETYRFQDCIQLPKHRTDWDLTAYGGVRARRVNVLRDGYLLDIVKVELPAKRQVDLIYHVSGKLADPAGWAPSLETLGSLDQRWFRDKRQRAGRNCRLQWLLDDGQAQAEVLQVGAWQADGLLLRADTPGNPPTVTRQTLVQRVAAERETIFVNAFFFDSGEPAGLSVDPIVSGGEELTLLLAAGGDSHRYRIRWLPEAAELEWLS